MKGMPKTICHQYIDCTDFKSICKKMYTKDIKCTFAKKNVFDPISPGLEIGVDSYKANHLIMWGC